VHCFADLVIRIAIFFIFIHRQCGVIVVVFKASVVAIIIIVLNFNAPGRSCFENFVNIIFNTSLKKIRKVKFF
jgi:hypothetical protein